MSDYEFVDDEPPRFMTLALNRTTNRYELGIIRTVIPVPDEQYIELCAQHPDVFALWKIEQVWPRR